MLSVHTNIIVTTVTETNNESERVFICGDSSLRKHLTFCNDTTRQKFHTVVVSLLLGSASDWLKKISVEIWPIRSTRVTQIWVVTHHQYGVSAAVPQMSSHWETGRLLWNVSSFLRRLTFTYVLRQSVKKKIMSHIEWTIAWLCISAVTGKCKMA